MIHHLLLIQGDPKDAQIVRNALAEDFGSRISSRVGKVWRAGAQAVGGVVNRYVLSKTLTAVIERAAINERLFAEKERADDFGTGYSGLSYLRVVAEGMEAMEQPVFLKEHACSESQGVHFSPPVCAADFADWMRRNTAEHSGA